MFPVQFSHEKILQIISSYCKDKLNKDRDVKATDEFTNTLIGYLKPGTFVIAGSFPDCLNENLKKFGDIDVWLFNNEKTLELNKLLKRTTWIINDYPAYRAMDLAREEEGGCTSKRDFVSYRINKLNVIFLKDNDFDPTKLLMGEYVVSRFNHSVTRSCLEYFHSLDTYILYACSVVGKKTAFPESDSSEDKKKYPHKHRDNVVKGVVEPNTLKSICTLKFLRERFLVKTDDEKASNGKGQILVKTDDEKATNVKTDDEEATNVKTDDEEASNGKTDDEEASNGKGKKRKIMTNATSVLSKRHKSDSE